MSTITIDQAVYDRAEAYAKMHNTSLQSMVEDMLKSVISVKSHKASALPEKWERLCGILNEVKDNEDERFTYIINK